MIIRLWGIPLGALAATAIGLITYGLGMWTPTPTWGIVHGLWLLVSVVFVILTNTGEDNRRFRKGLERKMRNYKVIGFEQFRERCKDVIPATKDEQFDFCNEHPHKAVCCASFCRPWRRIGRKDLIVANRLVAKYGYAFPKALEKEVR